MGLHMLPGNPPIAVELRRSTRARRLSLRVSRRDGTVTLTLPPRVPEREGLAFLRDREGWLRGHLDQVSESVRPGFGTALPVEGQMLVLTPGALRSPVIRDDCLVLPDAPDRVGARTFAFLKALARDRLAAACDRHAATLGRPYGRLTLRDTRSRWGSCTSKGDLMFSWRLVMAPPPVLDYVAAHEVAHLAEMNHSPAYWAVCARLCPGYKAQRRWLRSEGEALHRIRFGAGGS